jgi:hypothetical protein
MNRKSVLLVLAGVALLTAASWTLVTASINERTETYIGQGYVIGGVQLKEGNYLVIHDDAKLKEGAACTYFYKLPLRPNSKAVAELHCVPQQASAVNSFTMTSTRQADGKRVIGSIQFPGSAEVHTFR